MSYSNISRPSCYTDRHHYQKTLCRLATPDWTTGLIVQLDGSLCQVSLVRLFVEKIKGLLGGKWGVDLSKKEWVEYHIIHFLETGAQNQWLTAADLPLIDSLAKRAGLKSFSELESEREKSHPHSLLQGVVHRVSQTILNPVSSTDQTASTSFFYEMPLSQSKVYWEQHQTALKPYQNSLTHLQSAVDQAWLKVKEAQFEAIWRDLSRRQKVFWEAIKRGDIPLVKRFLAEKVDFDEEDEKGFTPLERAIKSGRAEIILLLITAGADLCKPNSCGRSAIHFAVLEKDSNIALLCVEQALDIQTTYREATLLHMAAQEGHIEALKLLLARGANLHAVYNEGRTPLHCAAHYGNAETVKLLLESGAAHSKVYEEGRCTPLHLAVKSGDVAKVRLLIKSKKEMYAFNPKGASPLSLAASGGHAQIVQWFVKHGANIEHTDKSGKTLLQHAATTGNLDLMAFLLTKGADMHKADFQGRTAIDWAIEKGHVEAAKVLLANGSAIPKSIRGEIPLQRAILKGHVEMVKFLIETGADVNQTNSFWKTSLQAIKSIPIPWKERVKKSKIEGTPLYMAAQKGNLQIVRLLLEAGADVNKTSGEFSTPLNVAILGGYIGIVKILIENGANTSKKIFAGIDISLKNPFKNPIVWMSPLFLAGCTENVELTKFFLDKHTGNLEPSDDAYFGAASKSADIMKLLLEKGWDVHRAASGHVNQLASAKMVLSQDYEKITAIILDKDPEALSYAKESLWRKMIAHVTDQEGYSLMRESNSQKNYLNLAGMRKGGYIWKKIAKRSAVFASECGVISKEFAQILHETAEFAAKERPSEEAFTRWQDGFPIFLNTGYTGHYMGVLLWNNQLVVSDLNGEHFSRIQSLTFDKSLLTKEVLDQIADYHFINRDTKYDILDKLCAEINVQSHPFNRILSSIKVEAQKVSNCRWFNSQGLVLPLQIMHAYNERRKEGSVSSASLQTIATEQQQIFAQWRSYQQVYALQKYLKTIDQGNRQQPPDFGLVDRAFTSCYPYRTMDKLDPALAQKWRDTEALFVRHVPLWNQARFQTRKRLLAVAQSLVNYLG